METLFLQVFLLINCFALGIVCTLAFRHWYKHFSKRPPAAVSPIHLSPEVKEKLQKDAETKFEAALDRSAVALTHDLGKSSAELSKLLEKFGGDMLDDELKLMRRSLDHLRRDAEQTITTAEHTISHQHLQLRDKLLQLQTEFEAKLTSKHAALDDALARRQQELESALAADIAAEKQRLVAALDQQLSAAISAYLMEALSNNVDLGAQTPYLLRTLETHKEELKQGVAHESPATP